MTPIQVERFLRTDIGQVRIASLYRKCGVKLSDKARFTECQITGIIFVCTTADYGENTVLSHLILYNYFMKGVQLESLSVAMSLPLDIIQAELMRCMTIIRHKYLLHILCGMYPSGAIAESHLKDGLKLAFGDYLSKMNNDAVKVVSSRIPLEELDLSVRAYDCFKRCNYNSVFDAINLLLSMEISKLPYASKSVVFSIIEALDKYISTTYFTKNMRYWYNSWYDLKECCKK